MEIKSFNITISYNELIALTKTLGRISDTEYKEKGLTGNQISLLHDIWHELIGIANLYEEEQNV